MQFLLQLKWMPCVAAIVIALAVVLVGATALPCAAQQQPDDLEKQLQQLKQQYDTTTHDLEKRIATLEQEIQQQKEANEKAEKAKEGTISTVELAAEQAAKSAVLGQADQVSAKYQGALPSEPTYDLLHDAESKISNLQLCNITVPVNKHQGRMSQAHWSGMDLDREVYLCGPSEFEQAVLDGLEKAGFERTKVKKESYEY